jgi:hypothetical protein
VAKGTAGLARCDVCGHKQGRCLGASAGDVQCFDLVTVRFDVFHRVVWASQSRVCNRAVDDEQEGRVGDVGVSTRVALLQDALSLSESAPLA